MPRPDTAFPALAAILASSGLLTLAVLVALEGIPGRDREARHAWSGRADDPWRLRPGDHGVDIAVDPSVPRLRLADEIGPERRIVRVVYPGLTGPR